MTQTSGQMPNRHSQYEPFPWIFWVRMVQLGLTVLIIALNAYAASQGIGVWGIGVSWWTLIFTILWVPAVTWGVPRIPANYRPNIIVLVFECFSWFWWLLAFVGLALVSTAYTAIEAGASTIYGGYRRSTTVSPGSSSTGSSSSTYNTSSGTYSSTSSAEDVLKDLRGVFAVTKAATAFAAINWALFVATFIAICIKIHRQRKERLQDIYQANGNPNVTINNIHMYNTPESHSKQAEAHVTPTMV